MRIKYDVLWNVVFWIVRMDVFMCEKRVCGRNLSVIWMLWFRGCCDWLSNRW